jgi:hypothetical protein
VKTKNFPPFKNVALLMFFKAGNQVNVAVSHISETGVVFVQIPGAGLNRLEELMTDIIEHYSKVKQ